ncbi:Predicted phosphodiesterase [Jannaschia faecimaris]|uniref:Predicted phosphodiesterase n=1 Tax=Jannaschia faecimaris TaxID=1244108 RepID=A0A1H3LR29_9RHOB|nr:metallophosphoesterase family protein [Jannaschia faecimaris]SDY66295.1 Predicted phosphodiesterase [Jannaschia faecimaris]
MTHLTPHRVAVIADIHGNADALSAVLADVDAHNVDLILNLGDHFSGPLATAETMALIRAREMLCLRGNHDRWMTEQAPDDMGPSDRTAFSELGVADLDWLQALPATIGVGDDIFACHATPEDDLTYWMHSVQPTGEVAGRPVAEVTRLAGTRAERILLCGHTHLPGEARLPDGRRVLNPGSVGLPAYDDEEPVFHVVEAGTPDARYLLLTRSDQGWRADWRSLPYDVSRMAALARRRGRPDWAHALETGRMPRRGAHISS